MTTDFIGSLPENLRTVIANNARGVNRPKYYSATLANAGAVVTAQKPQINAEIQISEDLEAVLILMSPQQRGQMMDFIRKSESVSTSPDDLEMMAETVARRAEGYAQVAADAGGPTRNFSLARAAIMAVLNKQRADDSSTSDTIVPDLSNFFAAVAVDYLVVTKPDIMAVHDRIVDESTLGAYTDSGNNRSKELLSWLKVFQTYQSTR